MNKFYKFSSFLLTLLVSLSLTGCGGTANPAPSVPGVPTETKIYATTTATVAAVATAATATVGAINTGAGATYPNFGRADDYTWVAGQLTHEGSCWIVTYVSPLSKSKSRPDQYSNHFTLLPGSGWDSTAVKDRAWVVVKGQPEPGTAPATGCPAHGYTVSALQSNPNATSGSTPGASGAPETYPAYGHAPDYIWIAGQLKQQGSCWVVTYVSPLVDIATDQYNNQFALLPNLAWQPTGLKEGEWVVVQGQPEPGAAPATGCSAHGYVVSNLQPNPNATGARPGAGPGGGQGTSIPTTPAAPTTPTASASGASTSGTPSPGNGGSGLDIQVTQFSVSSNFEIRGQFNATNNGKTNIKDLAPTRIQIKGPTGEVVFEADAPSIQGGVMDMKPMAGLPAGMSRPYSFSAAPGTISKQVAEGDEVTGILTLSADGQVIEVSLPVTKVTPIRIP